MPWHLISENKFFCNFFSKLKSAFLNHAIIETGYYLIIYLKSFLGINVSVTKYVQSVDCVQELVDPISIDDEVIHRKKFKLLASVNQSGNLNKPLHSSHQNKFWKSGFTVMM